MPRAVWALGMLVACDSTFRQVGTGTPPTGTDTGTTMSTSEGLSCDRRATAGSCTDYRGSGWTEEDADTDCGGDERNDIWCPPADLGGCASAPGDPMNRVDWYYQGDFYDDADLATLQSQCETAFGTWY